MFMLSLKFLRVTFHQLQRYQAGAWQQWGARWVLSRRADGPSLGSIAALPCLRSCWTDWTGSCLVSCALALGECKPGNALAFAPLKTSQAFLCQVTSGESGALSPRLKAS